MKKLQLVTKILAVVLISAIAFVGVYVQEQNRMENKVKDYQLGMNVEGARVITLTVNEGTEEIIKDPDGNIVTEEEKQEGVDYTTEEVPINAEEALTTDNYKKTKQIIEERLKRLGVNDYIIKQDEPTGKIIIEIPEDSQADHIVSNISQVGKFEIVDSKTKEVLMDNSDIKLSNVLYNQTQDGTTVYLNIEFNDAGTEKLKNISTEYATKEETNTTTNETQAEEATNETTEETSEENTEEEQKEVALQIDGTQMVTTSFDDVMENGSIQLSMGQATTDRDKLNDEIKNASTVSTVLDTGNLPVEYQVYGNEYIESDITTSMLIKLAMAGGLVLLLGFIVLTIKYKKLGFLASISFIGMAALYVLLIRYTNVIITLEGIVAIALIAILNYIFNYKLLAEIKKAEQDEFENSVKESFKKFFIKIIPICILSIVFCFVSWTPISSFGMAMFWGIALMILYNAIITKNFLKS